MKIFTGAVSGDSSPDSDDGSTELISASELNNQIIPGKNEEQSPNRLCSFVID